MITCWHGDPELKARAVARMAAHRAADRIVQGTYFTTSAMAVGWRGCFHGCLTAEALAAQRGIHISQLIHGVARHGNWHVQGERLWGIRVSVGMVLDRMFEALPSEDCADFAVEATEALPVGADLSRVDDRWLLHLLTDDTRGVRQYVAGSVTQERVIESAIELCQRRAYGTPPSIDECQKAMTAVREISERPHRMAAHGAFCAVIHALDPWDDNRVQAAFQLGNPNGSEERADMDRWQAASLLRCIRTAPIITASS